MLKPLQQTELITEINGNKCTTCGGPVGNVTVAGPDNAEVMKWEPCALVQHGGWFDPEVEFECEYCYNREFSGPEYND